MKRTVKIVLVAFALLALTAATAAAEPNGVKLFSEPNGLKITRFGTGSATAPASIPDRLVQLFRNGRFFIW